MRDIRGETLYFVLLDRFVDGDADSNGGTNPTTHDPEHNDWQRYWGGDLQGVIDKLDYLEGLGVTTLVLSPVVEQIPSLGRDKGMMVAPFDGRWALDYRRLDPHLVPREEWGRPFGERDTVFDRLVSGCHRRGMRVLLQFVCNHSNPGGTGNPRGELHEDGSWLGSFEHDQHGLYRHGLARDTAALEGGEAGPAPFDPTSGRFRAWMRGVLKDWLGRGVDGFHFDHANQMPVWFWQELNSSLQRARPDAVLLGSWSNRGWDDAAFAYANRSGMRISDFGFQQQVLESLCWEGVGGFRRMAAYLERDEQLEDATSLLTSLDTSHSPRVLASGLRPDHLRIAVTMLMTARGVPWLLYGTEQGLRGGGDEEGEPFNLPMMERFESNGVTEAMWKLAALRRDNLAMQRGHFRLL